MISYLLFILFYMVAAIPAFLLLGHENLNILSIFALQVIVYTDVFVTPVEQEKWNFLQRNIYKHMSTKYNWTFNKNVWITTYCAFAVLGFINWLFGNHYVFN